MRYSNWHSLLVKALSETKEWSFAWETGKDCASWASLVINKFSDNKIPVPQYSSKEELLLLIADRTYEELITEYTGVDPSSISKCRTGDLVLYIDDKSGDPNLGICIGDRARILRLTGGHVDIPIRRCSLCWRIE